MTKDLDLSAYHDDYKERIGALITSKMKGEVAQVKEEKPKKPAAKSMIERYMPNWKTINKFTTYDDILGKSLNNKSRNHT